MGKLNKKERNVILDYIDAIAHYDVGKPFQTEADFSKEAKDIVLALDKLRFSVLTGQTEMIKNREAIQREIANLTHDLKTPIAVISASCECIEDGLHDKNYLEIIEQKTVELNENVLRIIASSKQVVEKENVKKRLVDTREFLTPILKKYAFLIEGKKIKYVCKKVPKVKLAIVESQIISVIDNLISNALKHTQKGKIAVKFKVKKKLFSFSVTDTGHGIAKEDLPFIFERFYSGDKARCTGGSGIGLDYVKKIIDEHGGTVEAKSKEGKGSVFTVTLPRTEARKRDLTKNDEKFIESALRLFLFPFFWPIDLFRTIYYGFKVI